MIGLNDGDVTHGIGPAKVDSVFLSLDSREWEFVRSQECRDLDCQRAAGLSDEFQLRLRLREFKRDASRMAALRRMLSTDAGALGIPQGSDDEVLDQVFHLLRVGRWHIHSGKAAAKDSDRSGEAWKQAPGSARGQAQTRKSWRLSSRIKNSLVVRAADLIAGEDFLENPPALPIQIMEWAQDPAARAALFEIHSVVYGEQGAPGGRLGISWVARMLESAFQRGVLVWVKEQVRHSGGGQTDDEDEAAKAKKTSAGATNSSDKTWFRMRLVDEDGTAMADEDYLVVDSAGTRRQGKLDSNGELYIPAILPPGQCTVSFPNIHLNPRKRK